MPFLEYDGTTRELAPGETLVGSGSQAAWRVTSADLAARHFSVTVDGSGAATLKPYSPQNIVVVNGRQVPVEGLPLSSGDRVAAGLAVFSFLAAQNSPRPQAAAPVGTALLVDDAERTVYTLRKRTVSIGRDAASTVVVRDPAVSRFHADVRGEAGEHVVYSSGAAGTKVNGEPVETPRLLQEGDTVAVGGTSLRFTRQAAPSGYSVSQGSEAEDDKQTRRDTIVAANAVTGEGGSYAPKKSPVIPIVIALVVIAAIVYFVVLR